MQEKLYHLCSLRDPTDLEIDELVQLVKDKNCPDLNKENVFGSTPIESLCRLMDNKNRKLKLFLEILMKRNTGQ